MMINIKKVTSLVLSILLIFGLFSISLSAATYGKYEIFSYKIDNEIAIITDCDTSIFGKVEIPSTIEGYPLLVIGANTFSNCTGITEIIIPEGVEKIESRSFKDCSGLISITLPVSLSQIGNDAFENCEKLENVYINDISAWCNIDFDLSLSPDYYYEEVFKSNPLYYAKNLYLNNELIESVTVPDNVAKIPGFAFCCDNIKNVNISNGVSVIDKFAFYNHKNLTDISIPKSIISIGYNAFYGCEALQRVYIYDLAAWCNVEVITDLKNIHSNYASPLFYANSLYLNGELLENIEIPYGVTNIPTCAFSCESLKTIIIPNSVTTIEEYAFYNCINLENISIPDSVENIGGFVFRQCRSLKNINLPKNITSIGGFSFHTCTSLSEIAIPDGVRSIGYQAFYNCSGLESIVIPQSVSEISDFAFNSCNALKNIYFAGSATEWKNLLSKAISPGSNNILADITAQYYFGIDEKADYNNDGVFNACDLVVFKKEIMIDSPRMYDINSDGFMDIRDMIYLKRAILEL